MSSAWIAVALSFTDDSAYGRAVRGAATRGLEGEAAPEPDKSLGHVADRLRATQPATGLDLWADAVEAAEASRGALVDRVGLLGGGSGWFQQYLAGPLGRA